MRSDVAQFHFGPPPRGDAIPKWMWNGPIAAEVPAIIFQEVFNEPVELPLEHLLVRHRAALIKAARRRIRALNRRPDRPILLSREDFVDLNLPFDMLDTMRQTSSVIPFASDQPTKGVPASKHRKREALDGVVMRSGSDTVAEARRAAAIH